MVSGKKKFRNSYFFIGNIYQKNTSTVYAIGIHMLKESKLLHMFDVETKDTERRQ